MVFSPQSNYIKAKDVDIGEEKKCPFNSFFLGHEVLNQISHSSSSKKKGHVSQKEFKGG